MQKRKVSYTEQVEKFVKGLEEIKENQKKEMDAQKRDKFDDRLFQILFSAFIFFAGLLIGELNESTFKAVFIFCMVIFAADIIAYILSKMVNRVNRIISIQFILSSLTLSGSAIVIFFVLKLENILLRIVSLGIVYALALWIILVISRKIND